MFQLAQEAFPDADVRASTFEAFVHRLEPFTTLKGTPPPRGAFSAFHWSLANAKEIEATARLRLVSLHTTIVHKHAVLDPTCILRMPHQAGR